MHIVEVVSIATRGGQALEMNGEGGGIAGDLGVLAVLAALGNDRETSCSKNESEMELHLVRFAESGLIWL